jgi:hypothetical protein
MKTHSGGAVPVVAFKRFLLVAWAVWLSIVFLSNLADAAKGLGCLGESWAFASGNWKFIRETTARYGTPSLVNGVLFAGIIAWQCVAAGLFWRAESGVQRVCRLVAALGRLPRGG